MPRNGSGTYTLPAGNPVVTGTTISSTVQNNTMSDVATALTNSLAKDGQTTPTANLPMGGFKHTGVAVAAATTDYARADQVQNGSLVYLTSVSGTNTITASAPLSLAAYATGQSFRFIPAGANTGAVTININGIGAKSVTKLGATALAAGDIPANSIVNITYDGTQFQLTGSVAVTAGTATKATNLAGGSAGVIPYQSAADTTGFSAAGTSGQVLRSGGTGAPTWSSGSILKQFQYTADGSTLTGTTTIPADGSIPQNTEGNQYLSVSITPTSTTSTLEIDAQLMISTSAGVGNVLIAALFVDSTANALAASFEYVEVSGGGFGRILTIKHKMTSGTTSAMTFKVRAGSNAAGTTTVNGLLGGVSNTFISVKEYA